MSDFIVSSRLTVLGFSLPTWRGTALKRLRAACLHVLPSGRPSDWAEFYTRGIIDDRRFSFMRRCFRSRGTFFLQCQRQAERDIVATVERALRDIGLDTGIASAHTYRASRYQIPVTGVWGVTEAEVWFNTAQHDESVILVAVSLTDS